MTGNTKTTSRLDEEVGAFSLNHTQMYVGNLSTNDGSLSKAVSLLTGTANEGPASSVTLYVLTRDDATRLLAFLDRVLSHDLPASFQFPAAENSFLFMDGQIEWTVSNFIKEWHGEGGFAGKLGGSPRHIITKVSAASLRECISCFFGIDAK
jgi:hypothetical protein